LNDHPLRFRYHPAQVVPHADAEPSGTHDWEAIERAGGVRRAEHGNHYDNNYRGIITARGEEASSGAAPVTALTTLIDK